MDKKYRPMSNWICDCLSPHNDLHTRDEKICFRCEKKKPSQIDYRSIIKKQK